MDGLQRLLRLFLIVDRSANPIRFDAADRLPASAHRAGSAVPARAPGQHLRRAARTSPPSHRLDSIGDVRIGWPAASDAPRGCRAQPPLGRSSCAAACRWLGPARSGGGQLLLLLLNPGQFLRDSAYSIRAAQCFQHPRDALDGFVLRLSGASKIHGEQPFFLRRLLWRFVNPHAPLLRRRPAGRRFAERAHDAGSRSRVSKTASRLPAVGHGCDYLPGRLASERPAVLSHSEQHTTCRKRAAGSAPSLAACRGRPPTVRRTVRAGVGCR